MERIFIDVIASGLAILNVLLLFETVWVRKNIRRQLFIGGIIINVIAGGILTVLFQNHFTLTIFSILLRFILSFYYESKIANKMLITTLVAAIGLIAESLIGIALVHVLSIPIEEVQNSVPAYMFGVLSANLFMLFSIFIIRIFYKKQGQIFDAKFNLLMAFMPIQSIILCFVVFNYSMGAGLQEITPLGLVAILSSILLIAVTLVILERQRKSLLYKRGYELSRSQLEMQIAHHRDLYEEQWRIKAIRHDMKDNLIAISAMLKENQVAESLGRINELCKEAAATEITAYTNIPSIDAILNAKMQRAGKFDIEIITSIVIDKELLVNQFDMAVIFANALDNAIEGILRGVATGNKKVISLDVSRAVDYITIIVENSAEGPVYDDFRTTKPDRKNHGFGMSQMMAIAHKYSGSFSPHYDEKRKLFTLKVMLENHQV
ncbi:MAG: GHKL domain-containing protein [Oscillospiraceae bacterium]|nr:GHKL domain-containing protein [Oscillospiraceae bacterium]